MSPEPKDLVLQPQLQNFPCRTDFRAKEVLCLRGHSGRSGVPVRGRGFLAAFLNSLGSRGNSTLCAGVTFVGHLAILVVLVILQHLPHLGGGGVVRAGGNLGHLAPLAPTSLPFRPRLQDDWSFCTPPKVGQVGQDCKIACHFPPLSGSRFPAHCNSRCQGKALKTRSPEPKP